MNKQSRPHTSRTGSVLLLTLLVVSLLLILVLSFVVFVRLELRKVALHQELLHARANARLGMDIALSRLQHLSGPDQRATSTADVMRGDQGNVYRPGLTRNDGKRHWVGVWDAGSFNETDTWTWDGERILTRGAMTQFGPSSDF